MVVVLKIYLSVVYSILKTFKVKNKIVFMSRQSNEVTLDFKCLINEINNRDNNVKIVTLCKKLDSGISNKIKYLLYMHKQMYHLATSKVCITDSYSPVISILKHKKTLKVIQIWHSLGAIKKFGYQTLGTNCGRDEKLSLKMNMHKNYDYIISGSEEMIKYFALAFNYNEKVFYSYGLPRIDYIRENKDKIRNKILKNYPILSNGKTNILYAPTFRTYDVDVTKDIIKAFDKEKYNLIIKCHMNQDIVNDSSVLTCNEFSSLEMLSVSEYIITDYSGISIEAASINVKTLYYVYDYEKYSLDNGLNIDLYKECKNLVYKDINDIKNIIDNNKYDYKSFSNYKKKYLPSVSNSTKSICDLIFKCLR